MANVFTFANLARSSLAGSINNTAISLNVQAGGGAQFPNPSAGFQFALTLTDAATGLLREIVYVTARSGDVMTAMIRGQEGTTALNWAAGSPCANLWTAGQATAMLQTAQYTPSLPFVFPPGLILPYAGTGSLISGTDWLLCGGQAVSRTTFSGLFAIIGTVYGGGDGTSTFNVPDLRGRVPAGRDDMSSVNADRLTTAGSGVAGSTLGASGGLETLAGTTTGSLDVSASGTTDNNNNNTNSPGTAGIQVASHPHQHTFTVTGTTTGSLTVGGANVQPTLVVNYLIKT